MTSSRVCRAPRRIAWLLVVAALASLTAGAALLPAADEDPRREAARLARENELLRQRIELASGKAFYLLLDLEAERLRLMLHGAVLQDYPVLGLEVGYPRVFFRVAGSDEDWQGRIWSAGRLVPPRERERVEIIAPPPRPEGAAEEDLPPPTIPPLPEEAYPVPRRYHVRYEGNLSLEIRGPGTDEPQGTAWRVLTGIAHWWDDLRAALSPSGRDATRLRLLLRAKDAESLYRALPPDTKLLVLPAS
jgi:hypothetical protein